MKTIQSKLNKIDKILETNSPKDRGTVFVFYEEREKGVYYATQKLNGMGEDRENPRKYTSLKTFLEREQELRKDISANDIVYPFGWISPSVHTDPEWIKDKQYQQ